MTGPAPAFSVVIPAYNAQATVASAVDSVLSQTLADFELIVVDDGSTDGTVSVVRQIRDPRVRLVSQHNRGLPAARNAGVARARARRVAFLDSDDLWLPRYLELADQALDRTPHAGFAYTDAYAFDPISGRVGERGIDGERPPVPPPADPRLFLRELLKRNFVYVSTAVPRDVLATVGGFDERTTAAEDYGLWLRILAAGYRAAWVPGKQALYRSHAGQMSRDQVRLRRGELAALGAIRAGDLASAADRQLLAARVREIERRIRALERSDPLARSVRAARRSAAYVRRRAGLLREWADSVPAEVAEAFPDLTVL